MTDFLGSLVERSFTTKPAFRARLPSRFGSIGRVERRNAEPDGLAEIREIEFPGDPPSELEARLDAALRLLESAGESPRPSRARARDYRLGVQDLQTQPAEHFQPLPAMTRSVRRSQATEDGDDTAPAGARFEASPETRSSGGIRERRVLPPTAPRGRTGEDETVEPRVPVEGSATVDDPISSPSDAASGRIRATDTRAREKPSLEAAPRLSSAPGKERDGGARPPLRSARDEHDTPSKVGTRTAASGRHLVAPQVKNGRQDRSREFADASRNRAEQQPATIEVTIGRVEVRVAATTPSTVRTSTKSEARPLGLEEYLRRRSGEAP